MADLFWLTDEQLAAIEAALPGNPTRKRIHPFDETSYKGRNIIERAFSLLKDWRRVATRYDKLATNYAATVIVAAIIRWWS